jgi:hypothetical protein
MATVWLSAQVPSVVGRGVPNDQGHKESDRDGAGPNLRGIGDRMKSRFESVDVFQVALRCSHQTPTRV